MGARLSIVPRPATPYIIPMSIIPPRPLFDDRPSGLADLDQRSRNIFRRLVDTYLETGEPVGSRTISRILPASLSSASVRNVMMDLEDSGLIYSPTPVLAAFLPRRACGFLSMP